MTKIWSKMIVSLLIIVTIFGSFGVPAKTRGQETPDPSDDVGTLYFKDSYNSILFVGNLLEQRKNINFKLDNTIQVENTQINREVPNISEYSAFYPYRLQEGEGISYPDPIGTISGIDAGRTHFLLVGKRGEIYLNLGLFFCENFHPSCINIHELKSFNTGQFNLDARNLVGALGNYLNGPGVGARVLDTMTGGDLSSYCVNLAVAWASLQQQVRDFFIPMPDAEHASINPNWTNKRDDWWEQFASGETFRNNMVTMATWLGLPESFLNNLKTDQFGITDTGAANAQSIAEKVSEIKDLINKIKNSSESPLEGGTAEWKCGNTAKLTEFKWDSNLRAPAITNLSQLEEALEKLNTNFEKFKTTMDEPVGGGSVCDKTFQGIGVMDMINSALCAIIITVKGWADGFFNWAVGWLKASLGVANNEATDLPGDTGGTDIKGPSTGNIMILSSVSVPIHGDLTSAITTAASAGTVIEGKFADVNSPTSTTNGYIKVSAPVSGKTIVELSSKSALNGAGPWVFTFTAGDKNCKIYIKNTGTGYTFSTSEGTTGIVPAG